MNGEVIKSFLVGLGFGVDDASLAKFNKAVASATLKVTALYVSIKALGAGVLFGLSKISEGFEEIGYQYKILAPAINKALVLRREMQKAYAAAGINLVQVIQDSAKLNLSLTKTRYAFEAIYKSVASRFFVLLTKQSDLFRQRIYANMPKIQRTLESLIKFIFKALEATTALGLRLWSILTRVYDFFVILDKATDGWSTRILGVIAAWKLLNLSFLATPLGMLLAGFIALLALWDDFKTFKEGGQSLINWGSETTRILVGLVGTIGAVAGAIASVILATKAWAAAQALINGLMLLNPIGLLVAGITALTAALTYLDAKWKLFGGNLSGFFSSVGGKIMDFAAGAGSGVLSSAANGAAAVGDKVIDFAKNPNVAANAQGVANGAPKVTPISNATQAAQNSQTNQHVQQQTNINVMGSADANAVGKAVAGEQNRVNFDMTRNMKGATR